MLINSPSFGETLLGKTLTYADEETGLSWGIEIFAAYRAADRLGYILLITDNIKVELSEYLHLVKPETIANQIIETYKRAIG